MRKLLAIATLVLASTATAQAQYTFDYGGRTIRIDPDRGTVSIPGVYDNTGRSTKRAKHRDAEQKHETAPKDAKTDSPSMPVTPPAAAASPSSTAVDQAAAPATTTEPANTSVAPPPATVATTPPPPPAPPVVQQSAAPASAKPAPAPTVGAASPAPKPAANPAQAANSPLGVWLTEEKEGKVRIEQCGANLCGYSVDKTSNANGEEVLINMKPGKDKWSGRIFRSQ
ncbi:cytoskeletal protein RodZ [Bradyrhizobium sp. JR6.1]